MGNLEYSSKLKQCETIIGRKGHFCLQLLYVCQYMAWSNRSIQVFRLLLETLRTFNYPLLCVKVCYSNLYKGCYFVFVSRHFSSKISISKFDFFTFKIRIFVVWARFSIPLLRLLPINARKCWKVTFWVHLLLC